MSLHEMFDARGIREIAQSRLWLAIGVGNDLVKHPKNEDKLLRERDIRSGLDYLEDAMGRYGTAHSEVQYQLRLMARKGKDGEENEEALMEEGMSTRRKLDILLEEAKAVAEETERM
ncbi:MAG: hypothetical protein GY696_11120, partial [Gammaproteobacteria bacterium]|nr:hypothetical protein [Gammaproteobacteria bacterium]